MAKMNTVMKVCRQITGEEWNLYFHTGENGRLWMIALDFLSVPRHWDDFTDEQVETLFKFYKMLRDG